MTSLPDHVLRLSDLSSRGATDVVLDPDASGRAAIAAELGLRDLRKFRFAARLEPRGRRDWTLSGDLGATVVQDCVVTLAPVVTRIDEPVARRYLADFALPEGGSEVEMPEDDTAEPLPATLDLYEVALEALALALPAWPRAEGVGLDRIAVAEPGVAPMTDAEAKPFAGLAALRGRLDALGPGDGTDESAGKGSARKDDAPGEK